MMRELIPYLEEPKAMHVGAPGKDGFLHMRFSLRPDGRSVMSELSRRVPIIVQQELYFDEYMPLMPCVYILSSGGPNVDGDRYRQEIIVDRGAFAHISTGAATKIAGMRYNYSAMRQEITLHDDAYVEMLPEPVIPCRSSRYVADTKLVVASTATLFFSEIYLSGRKHYAGGEMFAYDLLSVATHAERPDGEPLFAEKFVVRPALRSPQRMGVMAGYDVLANVSIITPKHHADELYARLKPMVRRHNHSALGMSRLPNDAGLQIRVLAKDSRQVKNVVRRLCSMVRMRVKGVPLQNEFPWR